MDFPRLIFLHLIAGSFVTSPFSSFSEIVLWKERGSYKLITYQWLKKHYLTHFLPLYWHVLSFAFAPITKLVLLDWGTNEKERMLPQRCSTFTRAIQIPRFSLPIQSLKKILKRLKTKVLKIDFMQHFCKHEILKGLSMG